MSKMINNAPIASATTSFVVLLHLGELLFISDIFD